MSPSKNYEDKERGKETTYSLQVLQQDDDLKFPLLLWEPWTA